jgi:glutamate/tyrosine decarboxylase-like PLP-dependent enzyme
VLLAHGRQGLGTLFASQVRLARALARVVEDLDGFELLPQAEREADRGVIVLFRAREERLNGELVERINGQNRIYVSGTVWEGRKAVRIAVAGWKIDGEADARVVREVLVKALL